jgi:hypothetical protein
MIKETPCYYFGVGEIYTSKVLKYAEYIICPLIES